MSSLVQGNGEKRRKGGSGIRKNCFCHLCPIESCKEGCYKALGPSRTAQLGTQPLLVQCLLDLWQFVSPTFSVLPSVSELLTRS